MATYTEIQQEIARRGSVDLSGEAQDLIRTAINNSYKRVLAETFQDLRQRTYTVATTASRATVGLPLEVHAVLDVQDTSNRKPERDDSGRVRQARPWPNGNGNTA